MAAGAAARAAASATATSQATTKDRPKLCPAPTPESNVGWSDNSIGYQQYVTGLPPGLKVQLNDVDFDGCREPKGPMLEGKGAFEKFMQKDEEKFQPWFTGADDWPRQLEDQSVAARAAGMRVEWHVQEKRVADYIRGLASGYDNITVIWDPWP
ncbi:Tox-REase-5 domain-containing protein [Methylocapsa sp. S129]|uniref:Tox-REase-5 domain-containing protein n=1 Tax=Methylocapsa sp. S129 TaxID=1641869 RepID=UPI00131AC074|nr:Tox-REase-5 domain-containing protein [Methylocapsa sp. S129]